MIYTEFLNFYSGENVFDIAFLECFSYNVYYLLEFPRKVDVNDFAVLILTRNVYYHLKWSFNFLSRETQDEQPPLSQHL